MTKHLILLLLTAAAACAAEIETAIPSGKPRLIAEFVTPEEALADSPPEWVGTQLAARTVKEIHLVVPIGTPAIPVPAVDGTFSIDDFRRFIAGPIKPIRNALRLLGEPNAVQQSDGVWTAVWLKRLHTADGSSIRVKARINDAGTSVEWTFGDDSAAPTQRDPQ